MGAQVLARVRLPWGCVRPCPSCLPLSLLLCPFTSLSPLPSHPPPVWAPTFHWIPLSHSCPLCPRLSPSVSIMAPVSLFSQPFCHPASGVSSPSFPPPLSTFSSLCPALHYPPTPNGHYAPAVTRWGTKPPTSTSGAPTCGLSSTSSQQW